MAMAGNGGGMGPPNGKGQGGGVVGEKAGEPEGFVPERSQSALQAGKMLLEWKSDEREVTPTGQSPEERDRALRLLQGSVGEAIRAEQVPPGYHEAIKRYFDEMKPEKRPTEK